MNSRSPSARAPAPRLRLVGTLVAGAALGVGLGFFLHYLLYRLSLPVEPFIYVAF